jgi:hypothetical protein
MQLDISQYNEDFFIGDIPYIIPGKVWFLQAIFWEDFFSWPIRNKNKLFFASFHPIRIKWGTFVEDLSFIIPAECCYDPLSDIREEDQYVKC